MSFPLRTGLSLVQRRFKLRAEDGAIPTERKAAREEGLQEDFLSG